MNSIYLEDDKLRKNMGLYRGKLKDNNEWVYWNIYGELVAENGKRKKYTITKGANISRYYYIYQLKRHIIPESIGEFTGLTDKNLKKIWEGDIIDASREWWDACGRAGHDSPIIPVEWSECNCGFDPFANYDCDCGVFINANNCIVIGNIHDNPELLKQLVDVHRCFHNTQALP